MTTYMGIDGGGSNLRVVVTDAEMTILARAQGATANPNIIGREQAATLIRDTMHAVLRDQEFPVAVGIGISGASAEYAAQWLTDTVHAVLPDARVAAASDNEIALVGAMGKREGMLILAGTGSVVYGINAEGEALQVGGWGYLLGDEGSGYWIGLQALKAVTAVHDGMRDTYLTRLIRDELGIRDGRGVIEWLYLPDEPIAPRVARLARIVLDAAERYDKVAIAILDRAASELVKQATVAIERLGIETPQFAFAGGLLTNDNLLSRRVRMALGLRDVPHALHEPVVGAALLAKIIHENESPEAPSGDSPRLAQ